MAKCRTCKGEIQKNGTCIGCKLKRKNRQFKRRPKVVAEDDETGPNGNYVVSYACLK